MNACRQILNLTETTLTIKNSKFLAIAEPITSSEEAENKVQYWRSIHPKANHHCYAYRLGVEGKIYRANDDGEPTGTAGAPIYRQLQSFNASNTLLTVVRYFGGILLGASGLIKAYKQSARAVLDLAKWVEIVPEVQIIAECEYYHAHFVFNKAAQANWNVVAQHIDLRCQLILQGAEETAERLCDQLIKHNITARIFPLK